MIKIVIFVISIFTLTACAKPSGGMLSSNVEFAGSSYETIDLITLLDPEGRRYQLDGRNSSGSPSRCGSRRSRKVFEYTNTDLQCALMAFDTYFLSPNEFNDHFLPITDTSKDATKNNEAKGDRIKPSSTKDYTVEQWATRRAKSFELAYRRNLIQDQIINQMTFSCGQFKRQMANTTAATQFTFGSLTSLFASLGAVFTDPVTTRALSASAGLSSGLDSEYSGSFLQEQTLSTLLRGIDLGQQKVKGEIISKRYSRRIRPAQGKNEEVERSSNYEAYMISTGKEGNLFRIIYNRANDHGRYDRPETLYVSSPSLLKFPPINDSEAYLVSVASYSMADALNDTFRYHQSCSIPAALSQAERSMVDEQKALSEPRNSLNKQN